MVNWTEEREPMFKIMYQNDTMSDPEIVGEFKTEEEAKTCLQIVVTTVKGLGRKPIWNGNLSFTYRSFENTYAIHYWIQLP